jgi:hypothetical protein
MGGVEVYVDGFLTSELDGKRGHLQVTAPLPQRKTLRYIFDTNVGELQGRFGHGDEEKRICPLPESKKVCTYNYSVTIH